MKPKISSSQGSSLLFILPLVLILSLFALPLLGKTNLIITSAARDRRSDKQLLSLIKSGLQNLAESTNGNIACKSITQNFLPMQSTYSRDLCYLNDTSAKIPLIDTAGLVATNKCLSPSPQPSAETTLQTRTLSTNTLTASITCTKLAPDYGSYNYNISLQKLTANNDLITSGYIEIGQLLLKKNITILSAGDIFIDEVEAGSSASQLVVDIISIHGDVSIGSILSGVKVNAYAGEEVYLPDDMQRADPTKEITLLPRARAFLLSIE